MKKLSTSYYIFAVLFGLSLFVSTAFGFCILLTAAFFYYMYNKTDEKDRKFVVFFVSAAILARLVAFIAIQYLCFSGGMLDLLGDAQDNLVQGLNIYDYFKSGSGMPLTFQSLLESRYNTHGMTFFNGAFFLAFGRDVVSLKYLNILAIALAAWLVYDMARRLCSSLAGRAALIIMLFWPTLFIWSLMDLKESHLLLALVCAFWFFGKSRRSASASGRISSLLLALVFSAYFVSLKIKLMLPVFVLSVAVIAVYLLLSYGFARNAALVRRILYLSALPAALVLYKCRGVIAGHIRGFYDLILHYHGGFLSSGGWNIDLIGSPQDLYSPGFVAKYFMKAWAYFIFEPFPWHFYSESLVMSYPMLLAWYILIFFSAAGIIRVLRAGKGKDIIAVAVFAFIYITVVGMSVANIGTMLRFRDAVVPVVAIFASIGLAGLTEERCSIKR